MFLFKLYSDYTLFQYSSYPVKDVEKGSWSLGTVAWKITSK